MTETTERQTNVEPLADKPAGEILMLAEDVVEGRVFGSWMLRDEHDGLIVFMPLMFGGALPPNVQHVYEYMDKAGPRSVNGMPIFFTLRMLTRNDTELLRRSLRLVQIQRDKGRRRALLASMPWPRRCKAWVQLMLADLLDVGTRWTRRGAK